MRYYLQSRTYSLFNSQQVSQAQSIYRQAVRQYSQLIQKLIEMQMLVQTHQQFLQQQQEQLIGTRDEDFFFSFLFFMKLEIFIRNSKHIDRR